MSAVTPKIPLNPSSSTSIGKPSAAAQQSADSWLKWAAIAGCAAFLWQFIAYNFVDIDLWHQMALIRESLSAGHLLKTDPYAYTPTVPWIDHEWGAGAIAYFATKWFGGCAIAVLKFAAAMGTGFFCWRCSEQRGGDFRILSPCAPVAIYLAYLGFFSAIRAQAYSFFLTALWLWLLQRACRESDRMELDRPQFDRPRLKRIKFRRAELAALSIFPLWVSLHAGFVVAFGFTALQAVENCLRRKPFRHLLLLLGLMSAEILLNPYGIRYFGFLYRAVGMARPYAPEWSPVYSLSTISTLVFLAAALIALYAIQSAGWTHTPGILILSSTAVEATLHRKLLPLFAIAWLCYVPAYLQATPLGKWWSRFTRRRARFLSAAWIVLAFLCISAAWRHKPWELDVPQPIYPVGPVQYLAQQKFSGNLMVPFRLGAYVSWKLYPAVKVSLDSRYEVAYPDAVVARVFNFYAGVPGWRDTLTAFPTDAVLIPVDTPTASLMPSTGWPCVYQDQQFKIYARTALVLQTEDRRQTSFRGTLP